MRHTERLKRLQDLFSTTENTFVARELEILEYEIDISIVDAQIETANNKLNLIK